jgi:UDPglucose 6-dehydrogenase
MVTSALEATHADALLVLTEWPEFALIDPLTYARNLQRRIVVDGRNVLDSDRVAAAGLTYRGVGRSLPRRTQPGALTAASRPGAFTSAAEI